MSSLPKIWCCLLLVFTGPVGIRAGVAVGDSFPVFSSTGPAQPGLPVIAGRITMVDFWASWCAPCKESFPVYAQLHADYASRDFAIVAISVDEQAAAFERFVKKMSPPFPVWRDASQQLVRRVEVPAMPTCYLLDRTGRVRFVHQGFHGAATNRQIRAEIDRLLAENSSSP